MKGDEKCISGLKNRTFCPSRKKKKNTCDFAKWGGASSGEVLQ